MQGLDLYSTEYNEAALWRNQSIAATYAVIQELNVNEYLICLILQRGDAG